jgi:hypothetical protein
MTSAIALPKRRAGGTTFSEPASGLPLSMFRDAHPHPQIVPPNKTLSRATPWGGTVSVYLEESLGAQNVVRFMQPVWASLRRLQVGYLRQLQSEAEHEAFALHDLDNVDLAASQTWTTRRVTLAAVPDRSTPRLFMEDED